MEQKKERDSRSKAKIKGPLNRSKETLPNVDSLTEDSPPVLPQRVFLYLRLFEAKDLPRSKYNLELHLDHATHRFTKLEAHYTTSNIINLKTIKHNKPAVSTIIIQDSIDELSKFSEYPLVITLYERIKPGQLRRYGAEFEEDIEEEENDMSFEEGDEHLEALAQGTIDILQFFNKKRSVTVVNSLLYPLSTSQASIINTCKTTWQVYSLIPLLKDLSFCNLAFVTFESIYNVSEDLKSRITDLRVDLSFQSRISNESNEYEKTKICSFSIFEYVPICMQSNNQKWESIKDTVLGNQNSVGIQTGCKINPFKRFSDLLWPEDVTIDFAAIDTEIDRALVCNSMRRFVMTDAITKILESDIAFNQEHILLEFYNSNQPEEILLEGIIDLSIFLYPNVNACRVAVALNPPKPRGGSAKRTTSTRNSKAAFKNVQNMKRSVTFAIVSICVLSPVTETPTPVVKYNDDILKALNALCTEKDEREHISHATTACETAYLSFDKQIEKMISFMIEHDVMKMDYAKSYFCCGLQNLSNSILKTIACDFNLRRRTYTNLEFSRLMTTVYKELEQRIYKIVHESQTILMGVVVSDEEETTTSFLSIIKYLYDCGETELGDLISKKVKAKRATNIHLDCYLYLNLIENLDFEAAYVFEKESFIFWFGNYFVKLNEIYVKYMLDMKDENTAPNAFENLLEMLRLLTASFPGNIHGWILLHCLYKKSNYLAGITFTRWKFENLYGKQPPVTFNLPLSRWDMYLNYELTPKTERGENFYAVMKLLVRIGLYKFGEIIFQQFQNECTEAERYLFTTTFKILLNEKEKKYSNKTFPGEQIKGYLAQTNGCMDYLYENMPAAMKNFSRILSTRSDTNFQETQLGLLRYAYYNFQHENLEEAMKAFKLCYFGQLKLLACIGLGKIMYKMDNLEEAEKYFAEATTLEIHIPDVWGYLALVNLRLGKNYHALECWKYAKVNPSNVICEEILNELNLIDPNDINLFIDLPDITY